MAKRVFTILLGLFFPPVYTLVGLWGFQTIRWECLPPLGMLTLAIYTGLLVLLIIGYFKIFDAKTSWFLPIGFLLPAIIAFIYNSMHPGMFQYLLTALIFRFYSMPLFIITLVPSLIIRNKIPKPPEPDTQQ